MILLLAAGANVDKQDDNGRTPLMEAAYMGKIEVVRELLKRGAKKDLKNNAGKTAYKLADTMRIKMLLF